MRFNRLAFAAAMLVPLLVISGWTSAPRSVNKTIVFDTTVFDTTEFDTTMACPAISPDGNQDPPVYYAIDLITTKKIRGARRATGVGNLTYVPSPFGVAISKSGNYVYDVSVELGNIDSKMAGQLVAWVTSTDLSDIRKIGVLDDAFKAKGQVDFQKFLVVVTLEPDGAEVGDMWTGPVVLRGMSRSGLMHTKAGHGPFQVENCASYGFS